MAYGISPIRATARATREVPWRHTQQITKAINGERLHRSLHLRPEMDQIIEHNSIFTHH